MKNQTSVVMTMVDSNAVTRLKTAAVNSAVIRLSENANEENVAL